MIGQTDQANHQYDLSNFWQAVKRGKSAFGQLPEKRRNTRMVTLVTPTL